MMKLIRKCIRFTVEKNFLYLISALLVLIGSFQFMVDAESAGFGEFTSTIALLSVLQIYELVLAGVGYAVYKKLKLSHDGLMLALISLILVFDPTFFNSRLYTCASSVWAGLGVNIALLLLALGKFYCFIHITGIPLSKRFERSIQIILTAIYCAPFFFHNAVLGNKVAILSTLIVMIPILPLLLPRPGKNNNVIKAEETDESLHYRFEKYLFYLASLILPLHFYELSIIYDLPWGKIKLIDFVINSAEFTVLPWSITIFAPLVICLGIILMKTTRTLGSDPMLHKTLGWFSIALATCSGLSFASSASVFSFITPMTVQLFTVGIYMILTWSLTGDENCLWQSQLTFILACGGATAGAIVTSIFELNIWMLIALLVNLGLWSLFRGNENDHKYTFAAGILLSGKIMYATSIFTMLEAFFGALWSGIIQAFRFISELLSSVWISIKGLFNGTGSFIGRHKTSMTFGGAFILLIGGYYISLNKDSLLSDLSKEDDTASDEV